MISKTNQFVVIFVLIMTVFKVSAQICESESPYKTKFGDEAYFTISGGEILTDEQKTKIKRVFKNLGSHVSGLATETHCSLPENTVKNKKYKISNGKFLLLSDDEMKINFDILDEESNVKKTETLHFFGAQSIDKILDITKDSMTIYTKIRRVHQDKTSHLFERILTINIEKNRYLTIESQTYINGYFGDTWKYNLRK